MSERPKDVVDREHEEMKRCPHCNSINTSFIKQALLVDEKGNKFDHLEYECLDCNRRYEKQFKLPEEYWQGLGAFVAPPPSEEEVFKKYQVTEPLYRQLVEEVEFVVQKGIERKRIKIHSLTTRIKTFHSLYNKILQKGITKDPFNQINDIAGVRVICLYRSDLERIREVIVNSFDVTALDTTRTRSETHFGYMSDHYVVRLPKGLKGPRYDKIKTLKCEIQVRTILMDAWASVSQHLAYKKQIDIPSELVKNFNALSDLFYVADTRFELLREGRNKAVSQLLESARSDKFNLDQEMNLDTLIAYLRWKFPERPKSTTIQYSGLLSELMEYEYDEIRKLDKSLDASSDAARSLEIEDKEEKFYSDIGITRICLDLTDKSYRKKRGLSVGDHYWQLLKKYKGLVKATR